MTLFNRFLLLIPIAAFVFQAGIASAETIDSVAKQAIIVDNNTGKVLFERNADELMTPSSMSKLMTIYLVFSRLKDGSLRMTDELPVTETAWKKHYKTDESMSFLPLHANVRIDDLLRGVIIQSGNDACSVLAEGLSGSEEAFAELATHKGREIGLLNSTFRNASGVPDPDHKMTARDLSILARHLTDDFPDYYEIFSEKTFTYNNIKQDNRNPLIWQNIAGADGLKTGHTKEAGYGLVGSVLRNGRRVTLVLNGLPSLMSRAEESQRLIEWAFREFDDYQIFKGGEAISNVRVSGGVQETVPAVVEKDLVVTMRRISHLDAKVVQHPFPVIAAPVARGTKVGEVTISSPGENDIVLPMVAGTDVKRLGIFGRMAASIRGIFGGK